MNKMILLAALSVYGMVLIQAIVDEKIILFCFSFLIY